MKNKKLLFTLIPLVSGIIASPLLVSKSCNKVSIEELKNRKILQLASKDKNMGEELTEAYQAIEAKLKSKSIPKKDFSKLVEEINTFQHNYKEKRANNFFKETKKAFYNELNLFTTHFFNNEKLLNKVLEHADLQKFVKTFEDDIEKRVQELEKISYTNDDEFKSNFDILESFDKLNEKMTENVNSLKEKQKEFVQKTSDILVNKEFLENKGKISDRLVKEIKDTIDKIEKISFLDWNEYEILKAERIAKQFLKKFEELEISNINLNEAEKANAIVSNAEVNTLITTIDNYKSYINLAKFKQIVDALKNKDISKYKLNDFYDELFDILSKLFKTSLGVAYKQVTDLHDNDYLNSSTEIKTVMKAAEKYGSNYVDLFKADLKEIEYLTTRLAKISTIEYFQYLKNIVRTSYEDKEFWEKLATKYKNTQEVINIVGNVDDFIKDTEKYVKTYLDTDNYFPGIFTFKNYVSNLKKLIKSDLIK